MKNVNCPNCGCAQCKEVIDEKWVCLACDNVFLIHNLSKEFRQTDEHISEVHNDIRKELSGVKKVISNAISGLTVNAAGDGAPNTSLEAEKAINEGDKMKAYRLFREYSECYPESYYGYEGMFRALSIEDENYKEIRLDGSQYDAFDLLIRAVESDDIEKYIYDDIIAIVKGNMKYRICLEKAEEESVLEKGAGIFGEYLEWADYPGSEMDELYGRCPIPWYEFSYEEGHVYRYTIMQDGVEGLGEFKKYITILIQEDERRIEEDTKKMENKKATAQGAKEGFFGGLKKSFAQSSANYYQDAINNRRKQKERKHEILEKLREIEEAISEIDNLDDEIVLKDLYSNYKLGKSSEEIFSEYEELESQKLFEEEEMAAGYFQLRVANWGANGRDVYNILAVECPDKTMKECYKANQQFTITGFRKTQVYELQNRIMELGASAYVEQM